MRERIVAEGDVPKVAPTSRFFSELRASLRNAEDVTADLSAVVGRLRLEHQGRCDEIERLRADLDEKNAEVARLRRALEEILDAFGRTDRPQTFAHLLEHEPGVRIAQAALLGDPDA